ncbi:MAG: hypothetical protein ACK52I_27690 [Pseudomonadota bacterium]|jgi:hypothetical protein
MAFSSFSGPLRSGTIREGAGRNTGLVVLTQSYDTGVVTAGAGNVDVQMGILPQGSQIVNILIDQVVVPGGSSTSTISVGNASGGAQLSAAVATTAGGRFTGTATAATQLAWQTSTTADTPLWVRYTVGTAAGVGRAIITVVYVQRTETGAQNPASSA